MARPVQDVELTILAARLSGTDLNAGQERLVETLATSGRRVQLALAPAGSGKTTAMKVLADVWREAHVDAVGLAPSAAAAAALADATGMRCDTLAKQVHDLKHKPDSELVASIGSGTLLVIDEAGMADTLTLATVVDHAVKVSAVVKLLGDDQQLAAIGAGGVLRDIATQHGAVRLDDAVRFSDPSEADASLMLRDGDRAALGFYLDHDRVHVGDAETCLDDVLEAWTREHAAERDCLMLAPTRELVRELNARARAVRRDGLEPSVEVGNAASVGDIVLSRHNDRRLGVSSTDWLKNGDRSRSRWPAAAAPTLSRLRRASSLLVHATRRSARPGSAVPSLAGSAMWPAAGASRSSRATGGVRGSPRTRRSGGPSPARCSPRLRRRLTVARTRRAVQPGRPRSPSRYCGPSRDPQAPMPRRASGPCDL